MGRYLTLALILVTLAVPAWAYAGYGGYGGGGSGMGTPPPSSSPAASVGANGNPISGGLSYTPAEVSVPVGGVVRWTDTDTIVPHTATEDHRLWDVGGQQGFGPGQSGERSFAAGTYNYYCTIHGKSMTGTVIVAPEISASKVKNKRYKATLVWATSAPDAGEVFDVQQKVGNGQFQTVRNGTTALQSTFKQLRKGKRYTFQVRLRKASDTTAASDYSPAVSVKR